MEHVVDTYFCFEAMGGVAQKIAEAVLLRDGSVWAEVKLRSSANLTGPEKWDPVLDEFIQGEHPRVTELLDAPRFTKMWRAMTYMYGVDEQDELQKWGEQVLSELSVVEQSALEVRIEVRFPEC